MQKGSYRLLTILRVISEILFIIVFGLLFLQGRYQTWFLILIAGVVISIFFGRFFCGWICPMNTIFRSIDWLYDRLKIRRVQVSSFLRYKRLRYIFLGIFIVVVVFTRKMGLNIPILVFLTGLAFLVTLLFEETLWHNMICPFGAILNLTSRPAKKGVKINKELCIACGLCEKICPADAIYVLESNKRQIDNSACLVCYSCLKSCPTGAIRYR